MLETMQARECVLYVWTAMKDFDPYMTLQTALAVQQAVKQMPLGMVTTGLLGRRRLALEPARLKSYSSTVGLV